MQERRKQKFAAQKHAKEQAATAAIATTATKDNTIPAPAPEVETDRVDATTEDSKVNGKAAPPTLKQGREEVKDTSEDEGHEVKRPKTVAETIVGSIRSALGVTLKIHRQPSNTRPSVRSRLVKTSQVLRLSVGVKKTLMAKNPPRRSRRPWEMDQF